MNKAELVLALDEILLEDGDEVFFSDPAGIKFYEITGYDKGFIQIEEITK